MRTEKTAFLRWQDEVGGCLAESLAQAWWFAPRLTRGGAPLFGWFFCATHQRWFKDFLRIYGTFRTEFFTIQILGVYSLSFWLMPARTQFIPHTFSARLVVQAARLPRRHGHSHCQSGSISQRWVSRFNTSFRFHETGGYWRLALFSRFDNLKLTSLSFIIHAFHWTFYLALGSAVWQVLMNLRQPDSQERCVSVIFMMI